MIVLLTQSLIRVQRLREILQMKSRTDFLHQELHGSRTHKHTYAHTKQMVHNEKNGTLV